MVEKRETNIIIFLNPEKKEEARNVSEQRDKGWIHVIRVHDTIHSADNMAGQGNRRCRIAPHKERMSGLVKHRDYPPHSSIVNERYNSNKEKPNYWKGASSMEIRTGFFSKSVALWTLTQTRLPRLVACLFVASLPDR